MNAFCWIFVLLLGLVWPAHIVSPPVSAAAEPASGGLLLILVDTLDLTEIHADETWRELAERSAMGLLNTRTGGRATPAATHLSIGSSKRAEASASAVDAREAAEMQYGATAAALHEALTGYAPPPGGAAVLSLGSLLRQNQTDGAARPGWLGSRLSAAGMQVALIGNSDTFDVPRRFGALVAMDDKGVIPWATVGEETLTRDPAFPYLLRTDLAAVTAALDKYSEADLVILELGDLSRLDAYRKQMTEQVWLTRRRAAVATYGKYLAELLQAAPWHSRPALIVSPTPRADRVAAGQWLAPVLLVNSGQAPALLSTSGTRRPGIMLNTELAAAILALTGRPGDNPLQATAHPNPLRFVAAEYPRLLSLQAQRWSVLRVFSYFSIAVLLLSWPVLWRAATRRLRRLGWWHLLLLSVAAFPLAELILAYRLPTNLYVTILLSALVSFLLAAGARAIGGPGALSFLVLYAATTVALAVDVLCGAPLIRWSILGYDAIGGARFYGIGNEYMGVFLTAAIMTAGLAIDRVPPPRRAHMKRAAVVWLAAVAIITGAPWWGANNGGGIAAVIGFAFTILFVTGRPVTWRSTALIAGLLVASGALLVFLDLTLPAQAPSHLGALARQMAEGGLNPFLTIAGRKLAMNWQLFRYTIWTKVLVLSLVLTLVLLGRPVPWIHQFLRHSPAVLATTKGAVVTAIVALLANDSGVVAAATAMLPVTILLIFLATTALAERRETSVKEA